MLKPIHAAEVKHSEHELVNKENMQPNLDKLSEHEPNKRINPYMQPKVSASERKLNKGLKSSKR